MNNIPLNNLVPDYINAFTAYIPSKPDDKLKKLYKCSRLFRLNNNENPLGPSLAAQEIISNFPPPKASIYPSGDAYHLREKLGEEYNLHPDQFIVGNGANEVISFVIKAFCEQGDNIITADKTFAVYEWVAEFSGFQAKLVPLLDYGFDEQGMLNQIDKRTKILFLCNPNNPTGSYWNEKKIRHFLDTIDGRQIVVIDEAYIEYVEKEDFPDCMKLICEYPNVIVFRTFSKMYALAGLRIGYMAGSKEIVDVVRKTCVVYSINVLAQKTALVSLGDKEHIKKTREMVKTGKEFVTKKLDKIGINYINGEGNFLMIKLPISDSLAYRKLMREGIMIRPMTSFRYPNFIRLTISNMDAMEAFTTSLKKILT